MAYVANVKVLPQNALSLSGSHLELTGSTHLSGNLVVNGEITAEKLIVNETVQDRTVIYSSGSVKIGDESSGAGEDLHQMSGSFYMAGSEAVFTLPGTASYLEVAGGHFKGDGRGLTDLSSSNLVHTGTGAKLLISKDDGTFNLAALQGGAGVSFTSNDSAAGTIQIDISAEEIGAITKLAGDADLGITVRDWLSSSVGEIVNSGSIALTGQALALHQLANSGLIARTGAGTVAAREVEVSSGASVLSVTNGDGIAGNPTLNLVSASANTAEALVVRDASGDFAANEITVTSLNATSLTGTLDVSSATGNELAGATQAGQLLIGHATNGTFQVTLPTANSTAGASGNDNIVLGLGDGTLDVSLSKDLKGLTSVSASYLTASVAVETVQLTASSGLITEVNAQLINVSGGDAKITGSAMTVDGQFLSGSNVLVRNRFKASGEVYMAVENVIGANHSVDATDHIILVQTNGADRTVTLPAATSSDIGRTLVIKKFDDDLSRKVTIATQSSQSIDAAGATTFDLNGPFQSINLVWNGAKWAIY